MEFWQEFGFEKFLFIYTKKKKEIKDISYGREISKFLKIVEYENFIITSFIVSLALSLGSNIYLYQTV